MRDIKGDKEVSSTRLLDDISKYAACLSPERREQFWLVFNKTVHVYQPFDKTPLAGEEGYENYVALVAWREAVKRAALRREATLKVIHRRYIADAPDNGEFENLVAVDTDAYVATDKLHNPRPPAKATYLLSKLLEEQDEEIVLGDLTEQYSLKVRKLGRYRADLWFYADVLHSLLPLARRSIAKSIKIAVVGEWIRRIIH